jgi:hypothetical protein
MTPLKSNAVLRKPLLQRREVRFAFTFAVNVAASVVAWFLTSDITSALEVFAASAAIAIVIVALGPSIVGPIQFHAATKRHGIVAVHQNQAACAALLRHFIESAIRVDILSIRGLGLFALTDSVMRSTFVRRRAQLTLRILTMSAASTFVKSRATEVGDEPESLRSGIRFGKKAIDEMRRLGVGVTTRTYDRQAVWRLVIVDDRMFVSGFLPSIEGHDFPVLELRHTGPKSLYCLFKRQYDEMWDSSE